MCECYNNDDTIKLPKENDRTCVCACACVRDWARVKSTYVICCKFDK